MSLETRPVGRFEWEQVLRRMRKDSLISGSGRVGKSGRPTRGGVSATAFLAVAMVLASYGELGGAEVFPGDASVAVDCETTLKTVKAVRAKLIELGMLTLVSSSSRRRSAEWRLSLPVALPEDVAVLTPAQHAVAARQLRDRARGKRPADRPNDDPTPDPTPLWGDPEDTPIEPDWGGPEDYPNDAWGGPEDVPKQEGLGGSGGPTKNGLGGSGGPALGGSGGPAYQTTDQATIYQTNSGQDQITQLTVPDARPPDQDQIPSPPIDLTAYRAAKISAVRCGHGLQAGTRPDGQPNCPICRRLPQERPHAAT